MRDFRKENEDNKNVQKYTVFVDGHSHRIPMIDYCWVDEVLNEIDRLRKEIKNMKKRDKFDDEYERQLQKYGTFYGFPDGFEEEE
jgi:hypothetical protein